MITETEAVEHLRALGFDETQIKYAWTQTNGESIEAVANFLLVTMAEDPVPTSAPSHTASAPTYAVDPPCKLVLVVNSSLNMSPGKIASQCSHATLGAVFRLGYESLQVRTWLGQGEPIIVVQAAKEALGGLESKSMGLGLPTFRVHDAGRTEVVSGSFTVLAVGPAPSADIDVVTRSLSLL